MLLSAQNRRQCCTAARVLALDSGLRPRPADGGVSAAREAACARGCDGVFHAPLEPRVHDRHGADPLRNDRARDAQEG